MTITDENLEAYELGIEYNLMEMLKLEDKRTHDFIHRNKEQLEKIAIPYQQSLFVYGPVGTGKTVLITMAMLNWAKSKYFEGHPKRKIIWRSCDKLLQEFRNGYSTGENNEQRLLDEFILSDLLVIDDLLVESSTNWVYRMLFMVINSRFRAIKPTFISSNWSLEEITKILNDERLSSRIAQDCGTAGIFYTKGYNLRINENETN